jgi:hypothetical protein
MGPSFSEMNNYQSGFMVSHRLRAQQEDMLV